MVLVYGDDGDVGGDAAAGWLILIERRVEEGERMWADGWMDGWAAGRFSSIPRGPGPCVDRCDSHTP